MADIKRTSWVSTVVAIVIAAGLYLYFRSATKEKYKSYVAYYGSISGLQASSPVMIKGVRTGKIRSIDLLDDKVKVTLVVDEGVKLPADTRARLTSGGMLSDMSIVLEMGNSKNILAENATITSTLDSSVMPVSIRVTPYLEAAKYLLFSADSTLRGIHFLSRGGMLSAFVTPLMSAEKTLKEYEQFTAKYNRSMDKLRTDVKDANIDIAKVERKSYEWKTAMADAARKSRSLLKDSLNKNITTLARLSQSLGKVANTASDKKTAVGKLVNDEAAYTNTTNSLDTLNKTLVELHRSPPGFSIFGGKK